MLGLLGYLVLLLVALVTVNVLLLREVRRDERKNAPRRSDGGAGEESG